jgi:hypothetical protein
MLRKIWIGAALVGALVVLHGCGLRSPERAPTQAPAEGTAVRSQPGGPKLNQKRFQRENPISKNSLPRAGDYVGPSEFAGW